MKTISVFDIIGPNMIGPSSSHTAGALRIAHLARNMVKDEVTNVEFVLYGSFAQTYKGHGTDKALVAGILGFDTEDYRIKDSLLIAQEAGLKYSFEPNTTEKVDHPNTVNIVLHDINGETTQVKGISIGGGRAIIKEINGVEINFSGEYHTVIIYHKDLPGVVANITRILSDHNINIAFMKLYRETKGSIAYSIIEADEPINEEAVNKIESLPNVAKAMLIDKF
ncbi:MAG: L-serine ammonia-lyase, iron-sulfur-dependent, subunit beta [Clostridiales bacterium]|nr:L-serine ammonia-lyase, iron-sulfur-dependent, subunit beta [Clostridiales bacterium]